MSNKDEVLRLFKDTNTYYEQGHYRLVNGTHSDSYFQVRLLLSFEHNGRKLAKMLADEFKGKEVDKVLGFSVGGNRLATYLGDFLNAVAILGEKKDGAVVFPSETKIEDGDRILVVSDFLTTDDYILPVLGAIEGSTGGSVIGVGLVVDRRTEDTDLGVKTVSLLRTKLSLWSEETCPLCKEGVPLTDFSSPDTDSFSVVYSVPEDERNAMVESYLDFFKNIGENGLRKEIASYYKPRHELPGEKFERAAVLGSFDNYNDIDCVAKIVSELGYYGITSKLIYQKDAGRKHGWGPYSYESMNDFLGRMIFSCQYAIILYSREGGQFIETMWCSQSNKPTLGIVYVRPWEMENPGSCDYMFKGPGYLYCDGVEALRSGSEKVGGFICIDQKECPFPSSKLTKMILDFYAISHAMDLIGTDSSDNIAAVIESFLVSRGNMDLKSNSFEVSHDA
ncbi:MAG: hypothetical protein ACXABY_22875 [Candidatus Thorarchaeota archaeon]|jgi:orotate phosphoribosyltransferase